MQDHIKKYKDTYQSFPKFSKMKKLWRHSYWDGPLSGMCEINNQKYWFECIEEWMDNNKYPEGDDDFEPPWYRRFLIYKLTDAQLKEVEFRHDKFCRMVGNHTTYNDEGKRSCYFHYNETVTEETFKQYYKEAKEYSFLDMTPESDSNIIGWFEQV